MGEYITLQSSIDCHVFTQSLELLTSLVTTLVSPATLETGKMNVLGFAVIQAFCVAQLSFALGVV